MLRVDLTCRDLLASSGATTGLFLFAGGAQLLKIGPSPFKVTITALFWVGEPSTEENDFIPNNESYWTKIGGANYGGVDDPERRNKYWPAGFSPKQNTLYVALPYGEFTDDNTLNIEAHRVTWYRSGLDPR